MPAQLVYMNPGRPRRRARGNPSAAQLAARARFKAMVKSGSWGGGRRRNPGAPSTDMAKAQAAFAAMAAKAAKSGPPKAAKPAKAAKAAPAKKAKSKRVAIPKAPARTAASPVAMPRPSVQQARRATTAGKGQEQKMAKGKKGKKGKKKASAAPRKRRSSKRSKRPAAPKRRRSGKRRSSAKRRKPSRASSFLRALRAERASLNKQLAAISKRTKPKARKIKRGKRKGQMSKPTKRFSGAYRAKKVRAQWLGVRIGKRTLSRRKGGGALVKKYGLQRINPSGMLAQVKAILPELGVGMLSTALSAYGGTWLASKVVGMSWMPESVKPHAPALASVMVGGAAYVGLNMSGSAKLKALAPWALGGGLIAAMVHTLATVKMDGVSIGKKLGMPLSDGIFGDYHVGSYHMGSYHVGEYHIGAAPGMAQMLPAGGVSIPVQGSEGIFNGLGESIVMDPSRRLMAPAAEMVRHDTRRDGVDASVESYFGGSLSGDIFTEG